MVHVISVAGKNKKKKKTCSGKVLSLNLTFILAHLEEKEWIRVGGKL